MADDRDYIKIARKYRDEVLKDKGEKFCKWVRLVAEREKLDREKKWKYYFSDFHASDVCHFVELLPHIEGVWKTPTLMLEPWQIFILTTIFGWRKKVGAEKSLDDPRRFNTVYIELARKNGKSALSSAIALYCLCCENEQGPQIKTAATTGDQARIVFDICRKMVERTPDLRDAFGLESFANSIPCEDNSGNIKPINSKASTQDGLNPHCSIIDELHAHVDRSLFDVLKSARGARRNPMSWYITTAGYHLDGVCYEQRTYVTKILERALTGDHYFGIIYTLDKGDDHLDKSVWIKANPNLKVSVNFDELCDFANETKNDPGSEGEFKTKRCNIWLNAADAWLNMYQWDECEDSDLRIEDFTDIDCFVGADLADKNDVVAVAALFCKDDIFYAFPKFFLAKDLVDELAHKTHSHYKTWAKTGIFDLTPGAYVDFVVVEDYIRSLCKSYNVIEVIFDQYGSHQMLSNLDRDRVPGREGALMLHKSAKTYTDPALDLEARLRAKKFKHDGNPALKWMASNTVVDRRVDGSLLPKKESKNSPNKIDGIDAILMAMNRAIVYRQKTSKYEDPLNEGLTLL
jgi:phage terminase large subunit-like protein